MEVEVTHFFVVGSRSFWESNWKPTVSQCLAQQHLCTDGQADIWDSNLQLLLLIVTLYRPLLAPWD